MALIDANTWSAFTGQSPSGDDLTALSAWCAGVSAAIAKKILPFVAEPLTVTDFICDAPLSLDLVLPRRPIRSVTSLYLNCGAGGDPSRFTSADLLTPGTDYVLWVDDPENQWAGSGIIRRVNTVWGAEWRRYPHTLASVLGGSRGAVKVTCEVGTLSVPEDIQSAAVAAVTLLMNRRKTGAPTNSESWNGYSVGYSAPFTATAAVNSPDVLGMLANYLQPRFA
ncbi:hypothetical protein VT84_14035 [Gemmata sp. SH-PL17]|uniref:hypothetical protein n=1 Tax=Gemmata sp. SH-PL17 TaxID=1630693 RepID=UPI00078C5DBF|nr:hypothetical protein [Gemmata sp. SH-PL17]AMV25514.1 hypothetical protein VT84_14035 [Gemmata sp. SH-PL17]